MHRILFTLFCIIFVVGINEVWLKPLASIHEDAIELTQLMEKFVSMTPAMLKNVEPLVYCRIIDECCEDEDRSAAISLIGQSLVDCTYQYRFTQVMDTCLNSTISDKTNQLCPLVLKSIAPLFTAFTNSDVRKLISITIKYNEELSNVFSHILSTCNSKEVHALLCSTNKKLAETCTDRILQNIYNDYENYQEIILETKQVFIDLNQQLSEAFIKNINID